MHELRNTLQNLLERFEAVLTKKDTDSLRAEKESLERKSSVDDFWADQQGAQEIMKHLGDIRNELTTLDAFKQKLDDFSTLIELLEESRSGEESEIAEAQNEAKVLEKELDLLETEAYLSGKFDRNAAVFSIHAGQGGTEACDWVEMLLRMYLRYFEEKGWSVEITNEVKGEEAGISTVSLEVSGAYAYGYLKGEHGAIRSETMCCILINWSKTSERILNGPM
jgi:peptide chain release factor 2